MLIAHGLFFTIEFGVVSEDTECAELLASVALQILCNLGLVLDVLQGLEDEIVFACLIRR